jgi:hypothetical protein
VEWEEIKEEFGLLAVRNSASPAAGRLPGDGV